VPGRPAEEERLGEVVEEAAAFEDGHAPLAGGDRVDVDGVHPGSVLAGSRALDEGVEAEEYPFEHAAQGRIALGAGAVLDDGIEVGQPHGLRTPHDHTLRSGRPSPG
jgi:hypothetical protein